MRSFAKDIAKKPPDAGSARGADPDAPGSFLEDLSPFDAAVYDLCNKIYIDAVIEPHPGAEAKAAWNVMPSERLTESTCSASLSVQ